MNLQKHPRNSSGRFVRTSKSVKNKLSSDFWEHVKKDGDCLVYFTKTGREKRYSRKVYLSEVGLIPKGKDVCHSCDREACVNLKHLWLGTAKENAEDMVSKGRGRGTRWLKGHPCFHPWPHDQTYWKLGVKALRKFTPKQVKEIRKRRANGERQVDLMREFHVSKRTIQFLINRRSYKEIK